MPEAETDGQFGIELHGVTPTAGVRCNLSSAALYERALAAGAGSLTHSGGLAVVTTPHTGRSPGDRYIVQEGAATEAVDWGAVNRPLSRESYLALREEILAHLGPRELYAVDARAGDDPVAGLNVRVVTTSPWHALFARNIFLRPTPAERREARPELTILHAPELEAEPSRHGTRSGTFVVLNLAERTVLIGGTHYGGEIKKSVFSVLNYLLPDQGILPMHCSANLGRKGDVALFFGLSGTGKTTLSADPERGLIGDDEHGWGDEGVFNFEGGCYAKVIRLSPEAEPEIFAAVNRFGTVLENVVLDAASREVRFEDETITENTRACYPIDFIPNAVLPGRGGHPENLVLLTCDAFGVLPPIARLTPAEAMYHFLSGYTAKVAGTERGVTEPEAVFSAGFGAPFLPRHPGVYAQMLGERMLRHGSRAWLVNTGWTGGGYGVGVRMSLSHTRAVLRAALEGKLDGVETTPDPVFGLRVPTAVPNVPPEILHPHRAWQDGDRYEEAARRVAGMFRENFEQFRGEVPPEIEEAGFR